MSVFLYIGERLSYSYETGHELHGCSSRQCFDMVGDFGEQYNLCSSGNTNVLSSAYYKAEDKLYKPHTTDSVILSIVDYYQKKDDKERLFESYYYLGGTYRDMNDIPKALKAYHRAVEVGEDTEQTLLQGMTYGQMGILFAYQELYDDSRSMMRKALRCYGELGDSVRYANTLATLARTYDGKMRRTVLSIIIRRLTGYFENSRCIKSGCGSRRNGMFLL